MFYFLEYIFIFKFFIITDLIIFILFFLSFFSVFQNIDFEKFSIYECGFIPFIHTRTKFGVHFYLVGVIFVIFDVELSFLIPWLIITTELSYFSYFVMLIFLFLLFLGLFYEIKQGLLNWDI